MVELVRLKSQTRLTRAIACVSPARSAAYRRTRGLLARTAVTTSGRVRGPDTSSEICPRNPASVYGSHWAGVRTETRLAGYGGGLQVGVPDFDFTVTIPAALLAQQQRTQTIFTYVMAAIAAISLLVGGIGIMNIVLATVMERTREIGVRRSIGARRTDIVRQFLTESVGPASASSSPSRSPPPPNSALLPRPPRCRSPSASRSPSA